MNFDPKALVANLPEEALPGSLVALITRLLALQAAPAAPAGPQPLLDAKQLAQHLNVRKAGS